MFPPPLAHLTRIETRMISESLYRMMLARLAPKGQPVALGPGPDRESDLHDQITQFCRSQGWLVVHSRMDRPTTQAKGVTDFIIITPTTVLFIEVKRPGQKLSPDQQAFRAAILKLGWPHATVYSFEDFTNFLTT